MKTYVGLFLAATTSLIAHAAPFDVSCESLLYKPAQQIVLGVLSETAEGSQVLGIVGLLSPGHAALAKRIETLYGPNQVLWAGELEFQNGRIRRANETSGKFSSYQSGLKLENLRRVLTAFAPELLNDDVEFIPYARSREHMDTNFADLKRQVVALAPPSKLGFDLRHGMLNALANPVFSISLIIDGLVELDGEMRTSIRDQLANLLPLLTSLSKIGTQPIGYEVLHLQATVPAAIAELKEEFSPAMLNLVYEDLARLHRKLLSLTDPNSNESMVFYIMNSDTKSVNFQTPILTGLDPSSPSASDNLPDRSKSVESGQPEIH